MRQAPALTGACWHEGPAPQGKWSPRPYVTPIAGV